MKVFLRYIFFNCLYDEPFSIFYVSLTLRNYTCKESTDIHGYRFDILLLSGFQESSETGKICSQPVSRSD